MTDNKKSILGIGVATMDIYVNKNKMCPGGNEVNVTVNASSLGAKCGFLGVFGDDEYGPLLEEHLVKNGVDVSYCHHEKGSSGYSHVELKDDGDRVFLDWNLEGVTDLYPIEFTEEEFRYVKSYDVTCLSLYSSVAIDKIQLLNDYDVDICYDFSSETDENSIRDIAGYIKYGFFSCSHLTTNEIKKTLKTATDCGCLIAIGTRGVDSVIAYDGTNWYEQPTFPVEHLVDALGAGDSFIAAFLVALGKSAIPTKEEVSFALEAAAKYASQKLSKPSL